MSFGHQPIDFCLGDVLVGQHVNSIKPDLLDEKINDLVRVMLRGRKRRISARPFANFDDAKEVI
jgi:hypothetical protein